MNEYYISRCVDGERGYVIKDKIDCTTNVVDSNGQNVEPVDFDGILYVPCNVGDRIIMNFGNNSRKFKVIDIERTGHFFICEVIYGDEEKVEVELLDIAEKVKNGKLTTNEAHLKADQLLITFLYRKEYSAIADAFNKIPKYYE